VKEQFNEKQLSIFEDFIKQAQQLTQGEEFDKVSSLVGSAGTGKTWLTAKIIHKLLDLGLDIAMTTPTHKALGVISKMLQKEGIEEEVLQTTIHSFLNLKLDYGFGDDGSADNVTTKPKLVINKFNECLQYVDVLIIDESSMVSEELYNLTLKVLDDRCKMILFVGDQYQLLPIEGGENVIYTHPTIKHYSLTDTVRQKANSEIIKKSNEIRDYIKYKNYPSNIYDIFQEHDEIHIFEDADFLPNYFKISDEKIIGSYTNNMVDQYNNYVRYIELDTLEYLTDEDVIVFQKPYTNSMNEVVFQNGEQVEIQSTKLIEDITTGLQYWRTKANGRLFSVLDPSSLTLYNTKLQELLETAKLMQGRNRSNAWKSYFKLLNKYAVVKYAYASTLHKLQGSTVDQMFFDMRDLGKFYRMDPDNTLRLIYVATTRPSKILNILK